jgi:chromosomal replication initiator protein
MTKENLWLQALEEISSQISPQSYSTWFEKTKAVDLTDEQLYVEVPNSFFAEVLSERFGKLIRETVSNILHQDVTVAFVNQGNADTDVKERLITTTDQGKGHHTDPVSQLNSRYTFANFIVGPSNQFAHAAAMAVSESPAKNYNPLFIYGGVGLGKTHMMHAIGNHIKSENILSRVFYVPSDRFMNEMIQAIQRGNILDFRGKYRSMDILLIDDIHYLAGKEATQEEFFHTFNDLYNSGRQIVVTSDRAPKEIVDLEDRLISRFGWGLVTDIQAPDLETRVAILKKKAEDSDEYIADDVSLFMANNIKSNIRELEGSLVRLLAYSSLYKKPITLELAQEVLSDILPDGYPSITVEKIIRTVAEQFGLNERDILGRKRTQALAFPRQLAMYLSRKLTDLSLNDIGAKFGGKDHTTVLHAFNKIEETLGTDSELRNLTNKLTRVIKM